MLYSPHTKHCLQNSLRSNSTYSLFCILFLSACVPDELKVADTVSGSDSHPLFCHMRNSLNDSYYLHKKLFIDQAYFVKNNISPVFFFFFVCVCILCVSVHLFAERNFTIVGHLK